MAVLKGNGFSSQLCSLLHQCISTVSMSVIVDGVSCGHFKPTRGLRQGAPLSPYLFILAAEGLSRLYKKAEVNSQLSGIRVTTHAPSTSPLLFADDLLVFTKGDATKDIENILLILYIYDQWSGQQVNPQKSSCLLSCHLSQDRSHSLLSILKMPSMRNGSLYLGMPLFRGRKKPASFKD